MPPTDDTVTSVDISDNLDEFENAFFEREPVKEDLDPEEEAPEDDPLANENDEGEDKDEDPDPEEEEDPEPKPKPKNKTQERIEKLVAKTREQERREAELLRRIEQLEVSREEKTPTKNVRDVLPMDAPNPDAVGEDGEPVYPLGEFDPTFIRDLTKFTITVETKAAREAEAKENQAKQFEAVQQELADNWMVKLDDYETVEPEIRENIRDLTETFQNIDQDYGEYLASTIMMMDSGPQIMNYLSHNIGEAQKIVASGPAAATLALGKLDAILSGSVKEETKRDAKKVSTAQEPPIDRTRGRGGKYTIQGDTDDLDAFEREFFKKR